MAASGSLDGATITLEPGVFTFCDIKTGRSSKITTLGQATLNVAGNVTIGTGSTLRLRHREPTRSR